ncbi:MAG: hypothetical protein V4671_19510 [Armatimonadota bacterium]
MQEPETPEQWRDVVDTAAALLQLEAARQFGLVTSQRCRELLRRGRRHGYQPSAQNVARLVASVSGSRALLEEIDTPLQRLGKRRSLFEN